MRSFFIIWRFPFPDVDMNFYNHVPYRIPSECYQKSPYALWSFHDLDLTLVQLSASELSIVLGPGGSSRIRWHTSGHFAKIFMIIYIQINIYFYNMRFLIHLNDQKGLACASFKTPTHQQWRFWWWYRAIFNLLSTFKSHYHIKCSWLNHIVKRIVEIDPYVEKIERFANWLLIWWPHKSKSIWPGLLQFLC
jgi:hypothetical protein